MGPLLVKSFEKGNFEPLHVSRLCRTLLAIVQAAAAICLLSFYRGPLIATLDSSWAAVLTYAATKPLQFGRDIIFGYGPLGHIAAGAYSAKLFLPDLATNSALRVFFVVILFQLSRRLQTPRRFALVVVALLAAGASWQAMFLFLLVAAAWAIFGDPTESVVLRGCAIVAVAAIALFKATFLFFVFFFMSAGLLDLAARRKAKNLAFIFVSFAIAFLIIWLLAGQELQNLPRYLWSSFEITRGYSAAMSLPPSALVLAAGIFAAAASLLQIILALIRNHKEPAAWFMSLVLGAALFIAWKLGYTRADTHTIDLFYYAVITVLAAPVFFPRGPIGNYLILESAIVAVVLGCGVFVIDNQTAVTPWKLARSTWDNLLANSYNLTHLGEVRAQLEQATRREQQSLALPEIRRTVGSSSLDVFGVTQSTALANSLNYTPRPVFQGYSAYTPALLDLNAAFYNSERAPRYVLCKIQVIDQHLPSAEDAKVFLLLARDYRPVLQENGYVLLARRNQLASDPVALSFRKQSKSAIGREISVPPGLIWCQLEVHQSWLGKLIGFLYQTPQLSLEFANGDRSIGTKDIPLPIAAEGFLLNPLVLSDEEFLRLSAGKYAPLEIRSMKIVPSQPMPWVTRPGIRYRFSEVSLPSPTPWPEARSD